MVVDDGEPANETAGDRPRGGDGDGMVARAHDVYALRYASRPGRKAREFYGFEKYGELDAPYPMDYFFWLARNSHRTVLVDCGYDRSRGEQRGMFGSHDRQFDPIDVLGLVDVAPEDVDHVVLSHRHLDHVGLPAFMMTPQHSPRLEPIAVDLPNGGRSPDLVMEILAAR